MSALSRTIGGGRLVNPATPAYRWWVLAVTSVGALPASLTFLAGVIASVLGAIASLMRGPHRSHETADVKVTA